MKYVRINNIRPLLQMPVDVLRTFIRYSDDGRLIGDGTVMRAMIVLVRREQNQQFGYRSLRSRRGHRQRNAAQRRRSVRDFALMDFPF